MLSVLQKGQLGHGDTLQRNVPTAVSGLDGKVIVAGAEFFCTSPCTLLGVVEIDSRKEVPTLS